MLKEIKAVTKLCLFPHVFMQRFHRKYQRHRTYVHTCACAFKHTHLPDEEPGPPGPLSLRVCSGLEGTQTKTFLPFLVSFPFCQSPFPIFPLFLYCWFLPPPNPPTCTPFSSFSHGPVHPTPPSGASFSTRV